MESALAIGPEHSLIGIFNDARSNSDLCFLLINAGLTPRIGPNRLNVKIARALALQGVPSLRFDLAGLGDSAPSVNPVSYLEQSVVDLKTAMDFMQARFEKRRFLVFGICSGAENALNAALADNRVVGILMLDGFWYRSFWSRPLHWWQRISALTPSRLAKSMRARFQKPAKLAAPAAAATPVQFLPGDGSSNPPRETFARQMNELAARNVDVFLFYSSTAEQVRYSRQIADAFRTEPFVRMVRCEVHPDIDHTAVLLRAQKKLFSIIGDWASRHVAGPRGQPE